MQGLVLGQSEALGGCLQMAQMQRLFIVPIFVTTAISISTSIITFTLTPPFT